MGTFSTWTSIAKNALALFVLIANMINDKQQRGLGRMEATNEALLQVHEDVAYSMAIAEDAVREFKANPGSNEKRDTDFEVPDGQ